jgi:hypothetical protein
MSFYGLYGKEKLRFNCNQMWGNLKLLGQFVVVVRVLEMVTNSDQMQSLECAIVGAEMGS